MEPALLHGDVVLVRKSDIYPDRMWRKFTSLATSYEEEEIHQNAMRVLATEASSNRPIGEWMTAHTYLKPPTIHELGAVIVFQAPDAAKYPSSEYRAKRVIGLGGQLLDQVEIIIDWKEFLHLGYGWKVIIKIVTTMNDQWIAIRMEQCVKIVL